MSKFNEAKETIKVANLAGGKAFKHDTKTELILAVLTTFLEDKYYESGGERIKRITELVNQTDDLFVAKLAIVARNQFHLRSVSTLLISLLSRKHRGDNLVKRVIEQATERLDDLTELVALLKKPIPKQVKRGIRHALLKFSPYQLAKYKCEGKKVKLVDLFNLAHPNPKFATDEQKVAWKDLIDGNLKNTETWEARLSSGEDKKKVWKDLVGENKIGYMALLRNLRNIAKDGDDITIKKACNIITDINAVRNSKQLPFRFYNAYDNIGNQDMLEAISKALDISLSNVPKLEGKTLIAVDTSGSMSGDPIKKAAILAAALFKSNDADLIQYNTSIGQFKLIRNDSTLTISNHIIRNANGGGTRTSLVYKYALEQLEKGIKYDRIIVLSDNESWVEGSYGYGVQTHYNEYRKKNDCFIYCFDLQGYGTKDISSSKALHLGGYSDKIFDFMNSLEKGDSLIKLIEETQI
jgi:hypothetical protein